VLRYGIVDCYETPVLHISNEALLNPNLQPLIELQALDLRMAEIKEQQRKAPELIQTAEAPLKEALQIQKDAAAALEVLTKERRDRERDLEAHEGQTEKMKTRLSELKTNKEYQAHLFEIEMANKKKGEIEEQILVLMEKVEFKQKEVKEIQAKAKEAERIFSQEKQRLEALASELATEVPQLERKQAAAASTVNKALMDRYTKLKHIRKDHALVPIRDGICVGCRLQLPPQLVAQVKRSEDVQICSYCQRILYWEGETAPMPPSVPALEKEEYDVGETV
jgi:predicted  nucleic acid-binding Zn-ribbon protein